MSIYRCCLSHSTTEKLGLKADVCKWITLVGPCHHGVLRPLVAEGTVTPKMDGSCEYVE